ncbi:glutathione S-transferase family protein [Profundibacterium mesophilum]|uniref:Glutathione S-transferase n=1 Tax=Profundibacterium mesophilum KAUST100406-0324 TaxID=1037889 RepID=A0A921NSV8_9RHOB|nr:glutathione S-transferase family protein [Profundibacterium mesophilum]KAF0674875.1 Glutathione S-transferase [Profundibacterium mesophilum KAUST100406-0324]
MIVLHHCHQTRSMRSLWLLNELGVEFSLRVHSFDRNLREPQYLSLNPAGRVPALELNGDVIWETGAITEVLCERFPERGLGRPPGDIDRPDWLIWVHFAETISQHAATLTQQHIILRDPQTRSPLLTQLEPMRLRKCYAAIEGRLSTPVENREYLLTSGFSAADISVGQAVYMARHFADFEGFPELARWYAQITEREGFLASLPPSEGAELLYGRSFYAPIEA